MRSHPMFAVAVFLALLHLCLAAPDIALLNGQMFVNGQEFFIKGMDYSPTPLGIEGMAPNGFGGGGFCSAHLDPYGQYPSACYDSDYVDGSPDLSVTYPGPSEWFAEVWQRDLPNIVAMGFNTIRLYGANPTTYQATQVYTNLFSGSGKDHTQFMAYADQLGLKVIFPLYSDYNAFLTDSVAVFFRYLRWQINEVGNYSSLIMWQLGNELGYNGSLAHPGLYNDPTGMAAYNLYADYARRYTYSKWGRFIPITTAIVDLPYTYDSLTVQYHVDVLSLNVFRGNTFTDLFTGNSLYKGFNYSICATGKPILISEFGMYPYRSGAVNAIWESVINSIPFGVIGAAYFEYIDEPFYNKTWGAYSVSVRYSGSQNSNTSNDFLTDVITPKQQYYDLVNGTYNGQQYNIPENVYTLLGRAQDTPATSTDRCTGFATCPGSSSASNLGVFPYCNGNGVCDRVSGTCTCASGWSGNDCSQPSCPNSCSGNGQCNTITTPPQCLCSSQYFGSDCSQAVNPSICPNNCTNGNGICSPTANTCACHPDWTGADCSVAYVSQPFTTSSASTGTTSSTTAATSSTATGSTSSTGTASTVSTTASTATVASASTTRNSVAKLAPGLVLVLCGIAAICFM